MEKVKCECGAEYEVEEEYTQPTTLTCEKCGELVRLDKEGIASAESSEPAPEEEAKAS